MEQLLTISLYTVIQTVYTIGRDFILIKSQPLGSFPQTSEKRIKCNTKAVMTTPFFFFFIKLDINTTNLKSVEICKLDFIKVCDVIILKYTKEKTYGAMLSS